MISVADLGVMAAVDFFFVSGVKIIFTDGRLKRLLAKIRRLRYPYGKVPIFS